ncbi:hypothetical protein [Mechercharimyces sp. CAU 1602]|uniref:hypothetical protein n=1 Tax=Mechercharimyces sp. CAU 1602 TaxID=2973933 RepID=UPI0021613D30|nr:hypothetical protein [Mechercharimyces sp. CAU 1602]MCS1351707.1 hypothetical protein [Mechercharimyces sp. CAU 1602]
MDMVVYEPFYIFVLVLALGIAFLFYAGIVLSRVKLDVFVSIILAISGLTYLLVAIYMTGKGYYVDGNDPDNMIFHDFGFMELLMIIIPYTFLAIAASLGVKKEK